MSQLQNISEMIDVIHPDMMTAIQEMTLRVNKSDAVKIDSKGNVKNIGELFQILSGEVFKDSKIVNGMQKMSSEIMQAVKDNSIPQPPSFVNILNKVDKI